MPARLLSALVLCASSHAAVTRVELVDRTDLLGNTAFGAAGPYERIVARAYFAIDPKAAANAGIADIGLAPRNEDGLVEFSSDIYVLKPRDPAKGNGTALVEISNRGGKALLPTFDFSHSSQDPQTTDQLGDAFLLERGFTLVWIGWEFDAPREDATAMHLFAPIATDHGKSITGLVRSEWTGDKPVKTISLGDRSQIGYAAADLSEPGAEMFFRDTVEGPRTRIPRDQWRFEDARHVTLSGEGFAPGRIYEVIYTAKDPVVVGLGPAAIRDFVSFLKFGGPETLLGDQTLNVRRALGFGISQSGRFLREFLYEGFNADEQGRPVFDGVWAHVAGAGRGATFNMRFGQPSRDGHPFLNVLYPVDVPPFNDEGLLAQARAAKVVPKIFWTNGSYEYWGRCASLIHTTEDGRADAPPAPGTRIYFIAGTQHGPGHLPPPSLPVRNTPNINDQRYVLRALLVDMNAWLSAGAEPPPSRYPAIAGGDLVTAHGMAPRPAWKLDFSVEPPKILGSYPTLVPRVDADGNETSGVRLPAIQVPLGAYTGWNLRDRSIGAPNQMYSMVGSFIPFSRAAIAKRYPDKSIYLDRITRAAEQLVSERFLLDEDIPAVRDRAARTWEYVLK
ncbi:MAG TPA: alpha/beta hydrolase domain-containing protein [Bryobacteraceae bacterium]|nr:alpha/beta hydrolase domain-containing protein [Bryobacteraceae bacterium]